MSINIFQREWVQGLTMQGVQWFQALHDQFNQALTNITSALSGITTINNTLSTLPLFSTVKYYSTTTRAPNTVYQNPNNRPMLVSASGYETGAEAYMYAEIGQTAGSLVASAIAGNVPGGGGTGYYSTTFVVPPKWYYEVYISNINAWPSASNWWVEYT